MLSVIEVHLLYFISLFYCNFCIHRLIWQFELLRANITWLNFYGQEFSMWSSVTKMKSAILFQIRIYGGYAKKCSVKNSLIMLKRVVVNEKITNCHIAVIGDRKSPVTASYWDFGSFKGHLHHSLRSRNHHFPNSSCKYNQGYICLYCTMGNLVLFILACTSLLPVLVQSCTQNYECWRGGHYGCCIYSECQRSNTIDCSNYNGAYCSSDFDCTSGCCLNSFCTSESDSRCIAKKNRCDGNWECESRCCKKKQCQKNDTLCSSGKFKEHRWKKSSLFYLKNFLNNY